MLVSSLTSAGASGFEQHGGNKSYAHDAQPKTLLHIHL